MAARQRQAGRASPAKQATGTAPKAEVPEDELTKAIRKRIAELDADRDKFIIATTDQIQAIEVQLAPIQPLLAQLTSLKNQMDIRVRTLNAVRNELHKLLPVPEITVEELAAALTSPPEGPAGESTTQGGSQS